MTSAQEFDRFWSEYPRRIAKLAAMKAYEKARKLATAEQILDGVRAYRANKPAWQQWAHPASWLNAGRWEDDYGPMTPATPMVAFEQSDFHQQMYRNNPTYRAQYDAKQRASA